MGASHLKCMQNGSWNGTAPLCLRKFFFSDSKYIFIKAK